MTGLIPFNRKRSDLMNVGFGDFQNMLDDFFADAWPARRSLTADTFKIDVQDNENEYMIEAEMPGIQKSDIKLSLDDGKLNISVIKEESKEEEDKNYIHRERRSCSMSRNIFLADSDAEGIKAKLEDGILRVSVPKKTQADVSQMIEIE
ncbi:MAG: Hsp20/alpha crystallin family protein [Clostridia bacterium]|nr:Hsp20/alpha crystallin family protein [Clostridia bacterium]